MLLSLVQTLPGGPKLTDSGAVPAKIRSNFSLFYQINWIQQHRPQIAKTNFCAIKGTTSTPLKMVFTPPPNIAHYNGNQQWHHVQAMAPSNGTTSTAPCKGTLVPRPMRQKDVTHGHHTSQKVRELPRKTRRQTPSTEKYKNYHEKWTSKKKLKSRNAREFNGEHRFRPKYFQDHRKTAKSTRITTKKWTWTNLKSQKSTITTTQNPWRTLSGASQIAEKYENYHEKSTHRRSWRAGNDENGGEKPVGAGHAWPKSTKKHRQNEHASTKPRK